MNNELVSILRGLKRKRGRHWSLNKRIFGNNPYHNGWLVGFECAVDYIERRMKKGSE